MSEALLGRDAAGIQEILGSGLPTYRAKQIYEALYRHRAEDWDQLTVLPASLREDLAARVPIGWPEVASERESSDGTVKYLLRLADNKTIESVFMPEENRDTVCISSQVGCPVNCQFCLTALMGLERNLTAGEIIGQVLLLARLHHLDFASRQFNIVLMGMGEPLLNLPNVLKAVEILADPRGANMSERRITLSTSGIIPKIDEMGQAAVRPKLAISLNASTEETRRELMPVTRKYHLSDLLDACRRYPLRPRERLMFEYVLLKGINDSDEDARRVVNLLGQLKAKVNLIAFNPGPGIPYERPAPERVAAFQSIIQRAIPCFVRKPRGLDIYAACGQLRRMAEVETN